jgi:hypothetical protein
MDAPEGPNLWTNVQANRRIVWKNLEVDSGSGHRVASLTVSNFDKKKKQFALSVRLPAFEHWTLDEVELVLAFDPAFAKRLLAEGVKVRKDGTLPIAKLGAVIGPFTLDPRTHHTVDLRLTQRAKAPRQAAAYAVDVAQYVDQNAKLTRIGGQRLLFRVHAKAARAPLTLLGDWTHAFEEDDHGVEVLRPAGHELPPAAPRRGVALGEDGSAAVRELAPSGEHEHVEAFWHAEDDTHLTLGFADADRPRQHYEVVESGKEVLRLRRLS